MSFGVRIAAARNQFFDRPKVLAAVNRAQRRVLSRFGAYVRQNARQRIRRRKRSSRPGEAPTNRTGLLKRFIYFVFEPEQRSVIIGPVRLRHSTDAPTLLEHGGVTHTQHQTRTIAARPYMGPAFEQEQQKLPKLWLKSIRS